MNKYLIESFHLLLRPRPAVGADHLGRVPVGHMALVALLRLEEYFTFVTAKQTNIVHLSNKGACY